MQTRFHSTVCSIAVAMLGVGTLIAAPADAAIFKLVYTGSFNNTDALNPQGSLTKNFSGTTPFTATALFDDTSPNLAASVGFPGFVAYSPLSATLTVGGSTYNVATYDQDQTRGIAVAVFDTTTGPLSLRGPEYGVGFIQQPVAGGAGFVGGWQSASPSFSATHLVPTTFTNYVGVGYDPGPVDANGNYTTVVPIPLTDATNNPYLLRLSFYDKDYQPLNAPPNTLNTAQLEAVPEPDSSIAMLVGLGLIGMSRMSRCRIQ